MHTHKSIFISVSIHLNTYLQNHEFTLRPPTTTQHNWVLPTITFCFFFFTFCFFVTSLPSLTMKNLSLLIVTVIRYFQTFSQNGLTFCIPINGV